jgi:hypothetical protein
MKIRPEFLFPNSICPKLNTDSSVVLTPSAKWVQNDKGYLYDHYAGYSFNSHINCVLYSTDADNDTTELTVTVDLGNELLVNVIKFLHTNIKTITGKYSVDNVNWTNLPLMSNSNSVVQWYSEGANETPYYFTTNLGEYFMLSDGSLLAVSTLVPMRYLEFKFSETVYADCEKYIGELYIGKLYLRPNSLMLMSDSFTDSNSSDVSLWSNKTNTKRTNVVLSQSLAFNRNNKTEFDSIKYMINSGYILDYIPNPEGLDGFTFNFDKKDIYLVQARNEGFNYTSFGQSANGRCNMSIKEAAIVTRRN